MSPNWFLWLMLGVMVVVTAVVLPRVLTMRCPKCGARNGLDAKQCRQCGYGFPEDDE